MAIQFQEDAFVGQFTLGADNNRQKPAGIPESADITGIEIRLSRAFIIENKTPKVLFFPGFSKIYLIVTVVSDQGDVVQTLDLKSFAKVGDDEDLPVDKTIFFFKKTADNQSPSQIHVLVSLVKSKQPLREVGRVLADVKNDPEFAGAVTSLKDMIKNASAVGQVSGLLFSVASVFGKFLGEVDDKPLMTWVQSFTDINGDFDKLGKTTIGRKNNFAALDLSIIIRDTTREEAIAAAHSLTIEELEMARSGMAG
jgi:hypothetical protein